MQKLIENIFYIIEVSVQIILYAKFNVFSQQMIYFTNQFNIFSLTFFHLRRGLMVIFTNIGNLYSQFNFIRLSVFECLSRTVCVFCLILFVCLHQSVSVWLSLYVCVLASVCLLEIIDQVIIMYFYGGL